MQPPKLNGTWKMIIIALALAANLIAIGSFYGATKTELKAINATLIRLEGRIDAIQNQPRDKPNSP